MANVLPVREYKDFFAQLPATERSPEQQNVAFYKLLYPGFTPTPNQDLTESVDPSEDAVGGVFAPNPAAAA